ncbi:hypothetical protein [Stigmatella erecta]|uniref:Uncharacterized protein n=1 Tax=Stigmatella erecta TaxID=83460 RepID=A0A1I0LA51_9BACT|nr:hypothetical protein [Stigmatella erecta]SEU36934.1 hypothetical protein SAMN05443639_12317 [Stigmatella erecta]
MASVVQWGKGPRKCYANGQIVFETGELKNLGEVGQADTLLILKLTATVESTAALSALTEAQRLAWCDSLTLDLRFDGGKSGAAKSTEDEDNLLHPLQRASLKDLIRVNKRLVEKLPQGLTDSTKGFAQPIAVGITTMTATVYVSLGKVEFVDEDEALFGIGPDLLARLQLTLKPNFDYLRTVDSRMQMKELAAEFRTLREKAPGRRVALPPLLRTYKPAAPKADVTTVRGVPLDAVDLTRPLAQNAKGVIIVNVGGVVVTDTPDTAADVHDKYLLHPDTGAVEASIADDATPVYEVTDRGFATLLGGELRAEQETYAETWNLQATVLPTPREQELMRTLQRLSQETLSPGQVNHFTNTPSVTGVTVPASLLPAAGVTAFYATDPEAAEWPGLRYDRTGTGYLYVPGDMLDEAATMYAGALLENKGQGNPQKMATAVEFIAKHVPCAVEDEVKGFPSKGGATTNLYRQCRDMVVDRATARVAAARQ